MLDSAVRPWAVLVAVMAMAMSAGCGRDPGDSVTASTEPAVPATQTGRVSAGPTTELALPQSQQEYTSMLIRAWTSGDRDAAARYASPTVVEALFARPRGAWWTLVGCDNAGPRPACTHKDRASGGRLVLFYDADLLGQRVAVEDVAFLPAA